MVASDSIKKSCSRTVPLSSTGRGFNQSFTRPNEAILDPSEQLHLVAFRPDPARAFYLITVSIDTSFTGVINT